MEEFSFVKDFMTNHAHGPVEFYLGTHSTWCCYLFVSFYSVSLNKLAMKC